jgi:hypothetical protein
MAHELALKEAELLKVSESKETGHMKVGQLLDEA